MNNLLTKQQKQEIISLYKSGKYHLYEIADIIGCSASSVKRYVMLYKRKKATVKYGVFKIDGYVLMSGRYFDTPEQAQQNIGRRTDLEVRPVKVTN